MMAKQSVGLAAFIYCSLLGFAMTRAFATSPITIELLHRNEVLDHVEASPALAAVIRQAESKLPAFRLVWESKTRAQDQFIVIAVQKLSSELHPIGILVTEMNDKGVRGHLIEHSPTTIIAKETSCLWEQIVDSRYRDTMYLEGGELYKFLLADLQPLIRRTIRESLPFLLEREETCSLELHRLLLDIANGRNQNLSERLAAHQNSVVRVATRQHESDLTPVSIHPYPIGEFICMQGDDESVRLAHKLGLLDTHTLGEGSLLALSSMNGNVATATELVAMGCKIDDTEGAGGMTPLFDAAFGGHPGVVELLLRAGANPNLLAVDGRTPLFYAADEDVVETLLDAGVVVGVRDYNGQTAVEFAIESGRADVARFICERSGVKYPVELQPEELVDGGELTEFLRDSGMASDSEVDLVERALRIDYGLLLPTRMILGDDQREVRKKRN